MQVKERDNNISMTKGVAIILMVLVHSRFSHYGDSYINMFHMPLFFFMSGYCFKEGYIDNFYGYFKKRVKGAYLPYIKWGLLFLLCHNIFFRLNIYNADFGYLGSVSRMYSIKDILSHAFMMVRSMNGEEQLLGGYWFLHTYFIASFISFFVVYFFKRKMKLLPVGGVFLLVACMMIDKFDIGIPLYVGTRELLASSFIVTGFVYKQNNWKVEEKAIYVVPLSAAIVAIGVSFWPCSMLSVTWSKVVPYFFSALAGTLMIFAICRCWSKYQLITKFLTYVGDRTIDILTWHFLSFKLVSLIIIVISGLKITHLAEFPVMEEYAYSGWWAAYLGFGIACPLIIEYSYIKIKKLITAS